MLELKPIPNGAVEAALAKVERYRLLNEPREAESICRDILATSPDHQEALIGLLLSLTDQFGRHPAVRPEHPMELLERLQGDGAREYYAGVIAERWAKARLAADDPGYVVYEWLVEAMEHFERAAGQQPEGDASALLRWNACARIINGNSRLCPRAQDEPLERGFADH